MIHHNAQYSQIIAGILSKYGTDLLLDGQRFYSTVHDIAPVYKKENHVLRRMLAEGLFTDVYKLITGEEQKEYGIHELDIKLVHAGFSSEWRRIAMESFTFQIEGLLQPEQKQVIPKQPEQHLAGDTSVQTNLPLDMAFHEIEIGRWKQAEEHLKQALAIDDKSGRAYYGKLLCQYKARNDRELEDAYLKRFQYDRFEHLPCPAPEDSKIRQMISGYEVPGFFTADDITKICQTTPTYETRLPIAQKQKADFTKHIRNSRFYTRARKYLTGKDADMLRDLTDHVLKILDKDITDARRVDHILRRQAEQKHLADIAPRIQEQHQDAVARREKVYKNAAESFKKAESLTDYISLKEIFEKMEAYENAPLYVIRCDNNIAHLMEEERKKKEKEEKRKKRHSGQEIQAQGAQQEPQKENPGIVKRFLPKLFFGI